MPQFQNFLTSQMTDEAVDMRKIGQDERFFIRVGYAGFNSRANNMNGYASKARAEAVVLDYQNRR